MSPAKLEEENRRLVERERLDVAPTTVLGLFVVGRLARRHGMAVRLEPSDGARRHRDRARSRSGCSACCRPASRSGRPRPAARPLPPEIEAIEAIECRARSGRSPGSRQRRATIAAIVRPTAERRAPPPQPVGRASVARVTVAHRAAAAAARRTRRAEAAGRACERTASGLARRDPRGAHGRPIAVPGRRRAPTQRLTRDPEAERDAMNDYLSGLARGGEPTTSTEQPSGSTLAERHS